MENKMRTYNKEWAKDCTYFELIEDDYKTPTDEGTVHSFLVFGGDSTIGSYGRVAATFVKRIGFLGYEMIKQPKESEPVKTITKRGAVKLAKKGILEVIATMESDKHLVMVRM